MENTNIGSSEEQKEIEVQPLPVSKRKKVVNIIINSLFALLVVFLVFQIILKTCFFTSIVELESMLPTLQANDVGLTDRFFYKIFGLNRFDIIVIEYSEEVYYVKRLIGFPGEKIKYITNEESGQLYINDIAIEEDFLSDSAKKSTCLNTTDICVNGLVLAENQYFVMGDNRSKSHDSRAPSFALISYDMIVGRGFIRYGVCKEGSPDCEVVNTKIEFVR